MKNLAMFILEMILLAILAYIIIKTNTVKEVVSIPIPFLDTVYSLKFSIIVVVAYFIGLIAGLLHSVVSTNKYKNQLKQYEKRNEKLALKSETDTDDIEALKRKINSLEIALQNSINNKQS